MKTVTIALALTLSAITGCATSFTGAAHVEGGRAGCEQKCAGQGLALSGMVYMGEYSSACVCDVPGQATASMNGTGAATGGGAAGVWMQMQRDQQNQQQASR